jgi:diguanylate cyclase (GGDEF)-like protein/PAS domain S-box-containing protein
LFAGYALQAYELHKIGIDINKEIEIVESKTHVNAIDKLSKKEVDVAFVRTSIFEQLIDEKKIDESSFKIINEQNYKNYPFKISTPLYPEWPLVAMPHVDDKFLRSLIVVLFELNAGHDVLKHDSLAGFTPAKDYTSVEKILKEMRIYPFDKDEQINLKDVLKKYSTELTVALTIFITFFIFVLLLLRYTALLKKTKDAFARLIDDIGDRYTIFSYNEDGVLTYVSKGVTFITGKNAQEVLGKKWADIFLWSEDSLKIAYENIQKLKNREEEFNTFEMRFVDENQKVRILSITQHATFNKYGKFISIDGLVEDVTKEVVMQERLAESNSFYESLNISLPIGLIIHDVKTKEITFVNDFALKLFRMSKNQMLGLAEPSHPWVAIREDGSEFDKSQWAIMKTIESGKSFRYEKMGLKFEDHTKWISVNTEPLIVNKEMKFAIATLTDITNEKNIFNELKIERDRFDLAIDGTKDGLWDWDLIDNSVFHSRQFEKMLGYDEGELPDTIDSWAAQLHPDDIELAYKNVHDYLAKKGESVYESIFRMRTKKGDYIWVRGRGKARFDESGMPLRFVGFNTDITKEMNHKDELEHIAKHDNLTHLPNRFLLNELLQNALHRADRHKDIVAILYIDIDGFKDVNDKYGHEAGDEVLKTLSSRMQNALRQEDIVSRLGGDEFIIVVTDLKDSEEIIPLLKRLLHDLSQAIIYHNTTTHQLYVSASIGVTLYPQSNSIGVDALLRQADMAMYDAKSAGKNQYYFYDIESTKALQEHKVEVERIKIAIKNREFELYYQPKINMQTSQVLGFEALIRWNHPDEGLKFPDSFLPIIDRNQTAMLELGAYVFDEAFKQLSKWVDDGFDFMININVSSQELHEESFIETLAECFKKYPNVKPKNIELEILESSALENMELVGSVIKKVQDLGVSVALDDFGTGYSTLSYMKYLTVDTIKIDKSFIIDMLHDSSSLSILEAAIGLAEAFRCKVVAEGVESIEHGNMLIQLGCEVAQGYVASKALKADKAIEWVKNWSGIESWRDTKHIKSHDKNVVYAMVEHRNWIRVINLFLQGESDYLPQMDSNHCRFGVWLKSTAVRDYASKSDVLKTIDTLHESIHNSAIELVGLKNSDNKNMDISKIKEIHEQIIIELEKLVEV